MPSLMTLPYGGEVEGSELAVDGQPLEDGVQGRGRPGPGAAALGW